MLPRQRLYDALDHCGKTYCPDKCA